MHMMPGPICRADSWLSDAQACSELPHNERVCRSWGTVHDQGWFRTEAQALCLDTKAWCLLLVSASCTFKA